MGIQGLLPLVKDISTDVNIKDFNGCTAAIDVYCWIHRGCYRNNCPEMLYNGHDSDEYVNFVINRTTLLINAGVKPILVFDGQDLPAKKSTETQRRESRQKLKNQVDVLLSYGDKEKAMRLMGQCIDVTQEMAKKVINACREKNFDYIVAPYEADAQITYLVNQGFAHFAITEDSDFMVFGCKLCLFKMDNNGDGNMIDLNRIQDCLGRDFDLEKFRRMCILSGCDYLPNIPGIGLSRAKKFFKMTQDTDLNKLLYRIPNYLNMKKTKVTKEYVDDFIKAETAFKHQLVFCPTQKKLVPLTPYDESDPPNSDDLCICGQLFGNDLAYELAIGNVDIKTRKIIDKYEISIQNPSNSHHFTSIWDTNYEKPKQFNEIMSNRSKCESSSNNTSDNLLNNKCIEKSVIKSPNNQSLTESSKKRKLNQDFTNLIDKNEFMESYGMPFDGLNKGSSSKISDDKFIIKRSASPRNIFKKQAQNVESDEEDDIKCQKVENVQSRFFTSVSKNFPKNNQRDSNKELIETKQAFSQFSQFSQKSLSSSGNSVMCSDEEDVNTIEEDKNVEVEKVQDVKMDLKTIKNSLLNRNLKTKNSDIRNFFT